MTLTVSPQVEHVIPKSPLPDDPKGAMVDWYNLILACGPCNRTKSNRPSTAETHYLPESHNTHLAFEYLVCQVLPDDRTNFVCVAVPAKHPLVTYANSIATIELCGLDDYKPDDPKAVDLRAHYRYVALKAAERFRQFWDRAPENPEEFAVLVSEACRGLGFFSIWMKVFEDVPEICLALINAFPGTARNCFDPQGRPIPRNGNEI